MTPSDVRTFRFAPSPNGDLHLGHAYSALLNDALARRAGGRLLLRLEDIDRQRCRPEFIRRIEEDLRWLGLGWEEPALRQSANLDAYRAALAHLAARGVAYPCFCTRGEVRVRVAAAGPWPLDPDGAPLYPGTCRRLSAAERRSRLAQEAAGWRLDMAACLTAVRSAVREDLAWLETGPAGEGATRIAAEPERWGDALVARRDIATSYHLAVIVDDAAQGVTDVVRGRDLFAATGLHRLLQVLLGLAEPRYCHHDLILDAEGRKLAKSRGSPSLRDLRHEGASAASLRARLGFPVTIAEA